MAKHGDYPDTWDNTKPVVTEKQVDDFLHEQQSIFDRGKADSGLERHRVRAENRDVDSAALPKVICSECGFVGYHTVWCKKGSFVEMPPTETKEVDKLCKYINREIQQMSRLVRQKVISEMDVGKYNNSNGGGSDYPPLLDAKQFKRLQDKKGFVKGKVLAIREIKNGGEKKDWNGLAIDLKVGKVKFGFLTGFDRYDVGAICRQLDSDETDDWIGETVTFVSKKGRKGGTFVNAYNPPNKKK